jgi:carotenoid 1,2-hydratase
LSDDGRHGLTIIAFVGSVFSPYYTWALKRGAASAENHCALNVALYGRDHPRWSMTERGRASVSRDACNFAIGPSALRWTGSHLEISIDEINVPWPSRVRGVVRVHPAGLSRFGTALDAAGRHRWGPIAPCARVEADFERPGLRWKGAAYLDSNEGDEPVTVPFREWDWARAAMPDGRTAVVYDVREKTGVEKVLALRFAPSGDAEPFAAPARRGLPASRWRIKRSMRSDAAAPLRIRESLEDAPFYARAVLEAGLLGETVTAVHETLNIPRLASPITRLMLPFRMPRVA